MLLVFDMYNWVWFHSTSDVRFGPGVIMGDIGRECQEVVIVVSWWEENWGWALVLSRFGPGWVWTRRD